MKRLTTNIAEGEYFEFNNIAGMNDIGLVIWIFLAENSHFEWSYTEYKFKDGFIGRRISTSYNNLKEDLGGELPKTREFRPKANPENNLVYWVSVHSHPPPGLTGVSDRYVDAWHSLSNYYSGAVLDAYNLSDLNNAYRVIEQGRYKKIKK